MSGLGASTLRDRGEAVSGAGAGGAQDARSGGRRSGIRESREGAREAAKERGGRRLTDPQALMSIRNLELRARAVVEGFWTGLHRSPYHGFSVEFSEYRPYADGDDPRHLDWRLFARTDRYYLKKFEDETNTRCVVLLDLSRSMDFGTVGYTKRDYAVTLAATLAWFLHRQGDAVGLITFDEKVRDYLPARHRTGHLRHFMMRLEHPVGGKSTDLAAPLERVLGLVRKRSLMVLISDFLAPMESWERALTTVGATGHETLLFPILDPAEEHFTWEPPSLFRDLESEADVYVDPALARESYLARFHAHLERLADTARKNDMACQRLSTSEPLEFALSDFLRARMRRRQGRHHARVNRGNA